MINYFFKMISIPAAIARIARMMLKPLKAGIKANNPQAISQMANKSIPIFPLKLLIVLILSFLVIICAVIHFGLRHRC